MNVRGGVVGVYHVPLPRQIRVVEEAPSADGTGKRHRQDAGAGFQAFRRLGFGDNACQFHLIETVHAHGTATGFILSGIRENPPETFDAHRPQEGPGIGGLDGLFQQGRQVLVELHGSGGADKR